MDKKFCSSCGEKLLENADICVSCGKYINKGSSTIQTPTSGSNSTYLVLGFVFAFIALLFFPVLFGPLGILFGGLALQKGSKIGWAVIAVSIIFMFIGMLLGYLSVLYY
jgi:uncharacterized membrane protein YvbJ